MNILDVNEQAPQVECRLTHIFETQASLMHKYHEIEEKNGLLETKSVPVDLHDRFGQARLKNFAWRMAEELGESTDALEIHPDQPQHFHEEQADALHFLVELAILAGMGPDDILAGIAFAHSRKEDPQNLNDRLEVLWAYLDGKDFSLDNAEPDYIEQVHILTYQVIHQLARAMNCLKQKPWKVTHILTDVRVFRQYICETFYAFFRLQQITGLTSQQAFEYYFKKSHVNKFRQASKY